MNPVSGDSLAGFGRQGSREQHPPTYASGLLDAVLKGESLIAFRDSLQLDFVVCIGRQLTADSAYADVVLSAGGAHRKPGGRP